MPGKGHKLGEETKIDKKKMPKMRKQSLGVSTCEIMVADIDKREIRNVVRDTY